MPTWLGIDIGSVSVKVALVRSTYRKLALARVATAEVALAGGQVEAVRAAVRDVLAGERHERQAADALAVAIDGSRAAIHRLSLPATAQKQLADVLAYELEAQIPFDLAGAVFDWRLLERGADEGQLPIVAAVARIDDVRSRIESVKAAVSQEPERVGVGAFALAALVPYVPALAGEGADSVVVVDLGFAASEVLILERGEPVFARTLSIGTKGLPGTADSLARDLRVSFAAHRAQGGSTPSRVFLCGGGAFLVGAESFISGSLDMPVQVLPEPLLDMMEAGPDAQRELPKYAKAISLALSLAGRGAGMNLRRGPLAFERGFAWVRERIPILTGLAAVILVSFVFSAWARLHAVHKERDALEAALGTVTKEVLGTEVSSADEAQDLLSKEAALNDDNPMPHADAFDVMVRISESIPLTMKHDIEELDVQRTHATVHGIVGSIPDGQTIESTLSEARCMSDVKIKSFTQAIGTDRQKYVLELDIKCPEDAKPTSKKAHSASSASAAASSSGGK